MTFCLACAQEQHCSIGDLLAVHWLRGGRTLSLHCPPLHPFLTCSEPHQAEVSRGLFNTRKILKKAPDFKARNYSLL